MPIKKLSLPQMILLAVAILLVAGLGMVAAFRVRDFQPAEPRMVPLTDLYQAVVDDAGQGRRDVVTLGAGVVHVTTHDGLLAAWVDGQPDVIGQLREQLRANGLAYSQVSVEYQPAQPEVVKVLLYLLPALLLTAVF